jgi:hypothetical protein
VDAECRSLIYICLQKLQVHPDFWEAKRKQWLAHCAAMDSDLSHSYLKVSAHWELTKNVGK